MKMKSKALREEFCFLTHWKYFPMRIGSVSVISRYSKRIVLNCIGSAEAKMVISVGPYQCDVARVVNV